MITLRRAAERGHANHGWLDAHHSFSFGDYYDPRHMGFRTLRVLNDDTIAGGGGFPTHPHRDMEIITYILSGALEHKDSMGNGRVIRAGEFQYMAAGTGVQHSEFNHSADEPVHLLQTWIVPDRKGATPRYAEKSMADAAPGQLHLVASGDGRAGSMSIHQDADLWLVRLQADSAVNLPLKPDRHAWVQVAEGQVLVNGQTLSAGDAAAFSGEETVILAGVAPAQVLIFDLA